ncbi:molybdopterin-guanine dinucleotide biosynthesis protein B [Mesobacillus harenae]|uniref:molybdopterin-guanine dinucleotide biosynthesis protein B n=1 Tax=Mesobacillus harenae TaxID=2213203 RepID=UPI003BAF696A
MALVEPVIFQVAGFQNSGKTTIIKRLIQTFSEELLTVATIKHHGHGGKPDVVANKDSSKHLAAGAVVSLVEGSGRVLLQSEAADLNLNDKIKLISFFKTDIILIEGHKQEDYPKAVLIRDELDLPLLEKLRNIQVVFVRSEKVEEKVRQVNHSIPIFHMDDPGAYKWVCTFVKSTNNS